MRYFRVIGVAWLVTGAGAVLGSIVGNGIAGRQGLFIGAMVAGTMALLWAVRLLARLEWLASDRQRGGTIGGLVGFAFAATLAVMNLHTPVTPVLVTSLTGLGVVLGAGRGAIR